jgi:5-methylcytosine-specific restriction endonuclease McrA
MRAAYFNLSAILAVIFIILLILIVVFRKEIKKAFLQKDEFEEFIINIKKYLAYHYPAIPFNWKILDKVDKNTELASRESLVVSDLVEQFVNYSIDFNDEDRSVSTKVLWGSYASNCAVKRGTLPNDWARRKQVVYKRDHEKCQRCGCPLKYDQAHLLHITPPFRGGQHNVENMVIVCLDCFRVSDEQHEFKSINSLKISEDLMRKVSV